MRITYRISPLITAAALILPFTAQAQQQRPLDHDSYDTWKTIVDSRVSDDGQWISYALNVREGDAELHVRGLKSSTAYSG